MIVEITNQIMWYAKLFYFMFIGDIPYLTFAFADWLGRTEFYLLLLLHVNHFSLHAFCLGCRCENMKSFQEFYGKEQAPLELESETDQIRFTR